MKQEFSEAYEKLFNDACNTLRRSLSLKLKAMNHCAGKEESARASTRRDFGSERNDQANITDKIHISPAEQAELKA